MELIHTHHRSIALSTAAQKVIDYCHKHTLADMDNGQHHIDGENFFVNIFTYTTQPAVERIWEAHRQYIDVHIVLEGHEIIAQAFTAESSIGAYHEDRDYLEIHPQRGNTHFLLQAGYLAIFYPEDAYQTGIVVDGESGIQVRKAVFKIRL